MVGQRWVVATLWVAGALAVGRSASAEESGFDDVVAQALERYNARDFMEAADLFQRAYEIRQEPELIFNTARAYERAAETERAIEAYERFLTLENTTAALRVRAAENLSSLRAELMARRRAAELEEEEARRRAGGGGGEGGEGGGGEGGGGEGPVGPTPPTPEERAARVMTLTGWSLVGVGAATLVGAGIAAGLAYSSYTEFQDASVEDDRAGMRDATEQRALAADIMFGVGGAVAAAGAVLLIVQAVQAAGRAEAAGGEAEEPAAAEPAEAEVSVLPAATAGGVGLLAVGRF